MAPIDIVEDQGRRRLIVNGFELAGYLLKDSRCPDCGNTQAFADDYDVPFCPQCNKWLEDPCSSLTCGWCRQRPAQPRPRDESTAPAWYTADPGSHVEIVLDGTAWETVEDFYFHLLEALGAPDWHGHNLDALNDSLRGGDLNQQNPPLRVRIAGYSQMSADSRRVLDRFRELAYDLTKNGTKVTVVS